MRINGLCTGKMGGSYNTWIEQTLLSQSIDGNYSVVNVKEYVKATFSNSAWNLNRNNYRWITTDGQNRGANGNIDTRNYALVLLKDENYIINHNVDGSKNISIDSGFYISSNTLSGGRTNGNVQLVTIPRASHCTLNDFILENDIYINTNRAISNFIHIIDLYIDGVKILSRDNVAQDIIIKFSDEEMDQMYEIMSNKINAQVRINCSTWSGSTLIGYTDTYATCHIDKEKNKADYTAGNLMYYYGDLVDTHYGPTENVKGRTRITIGGFDFIGKNHATIKKIIMKIGSSVVVENEYQLNSIQYIGGVYTPKDESASISLTAIDSRGLESTVYYFLPDSDYVVPQLVSAVARRKNGVETETYLDLEFRYTKGKNNDTTQRNPQLISIWYEGGQGAMMGDITEEALNGDFIIEKDTEQYQIGVLKKENIQIHLDNTSGGFPLGQEFPVSVMIMIGSKEDIPVAWDTLDFNVLVNDGKFLDSSYKDYEGNYHSGYHTLPTNEYSHNFKGTVNFEELYINNEKVLVPYNLYESTGNNSNFEISDNIENYKFTEIYFHTNDYRYDSIKIFNDYKEFETELFCGKMVTHTKWYAKPTDIKISGKQVSVIGIGEFTIDTASIAYLGNNMNYIDKIIGYK